MFYRLSLILKYELAFCLLFMIKIRLFLQLISIVYSMAVLLFETMQTLHNLFPDED